MPTTLTTIQTMKAVRIHALGGPDKRDRVALALTAVRHVGFAIAVGAAVAPNSVAAISGVVLIYPLARGVLIFPYTFFVRSKRGVR
jgi:hypothetical protein